MRWKRRTFWLTLHEWHSSRVAPYDYRWCCRLFVLCFAPRAASPKCSGTRARNPPCQNPCRRPPSRARFQEFPAASPARHSARLGGRSHWWHKKQSHRDVGGAAFAFYCPGQRGEQRHGCGRRRIEPANSQATNIPAALADMGSRAGDGQTQNLHGGHECASLLL